MYDDEADIIGASVELKMPWRDSRSATVIGNYGCQFLASEKIETTDKYT